LPQLKIRKLKGSVHQMTLIRIWTRGVLNHKSKIQTISSGVVEMIQVTIWDVMNLKLLSLNLVIHTIPNQSLSTSKKRLKLHKLSQAALNNINICPNKGLIKSINWSSKTKKQTRIVVQVIRSLRRQTHLLIKTLMKASLKVNWE